MTSKKKKTNFKKQNEFISNYDPNGSYTGIAPFNYKEIPTQDADDL